MLRGNNFFNLKSIFNINLIPVYCHLLIHSKPPPPRFDAYAVNLLQYSVDPPHGKFYASRSEGKVSSVEKVYATTPARTPNFISVRVGLFVYFFMLALFYFLLFNL